MVMDMKVTMVCTLNCTKMMENKPQMLTVPVHNITTETGALKTCNSTGFHSWVTCFSSYTNNCQFIVNTDLLILHMTNGVSCITAKATASRTAIMVPSHSFNKLFQVKYSYISSLLNKQFYKCEHIVVKLMCEFFGCDYCVLLTINML